MCKSSGTGTLGMSDVFVQQKHELKNVARLGTVS